MTFHRGIKEIQRDLIAAEYELSIAVEYLEINSIRGEIDDLTTELWEAMQCQ